jgi:uncharacterized Tic20 family protein
MDINVLVSLIMVMVTIIGTTVPLYIYVSSQTTKQVNAIQKEMINFHKKLLQLEARRRK